jgi:bifunctional non-homologous end joining protein LigD
MLFDETGLKSPIFYSEDFAIDGAAMPKKLCAMQWKASSQECRGIVPLGRNEAWLKIKCVQRAKFPVVGFVKDPAGVAALPLAKRERKDFVYVGKVGTGFNRKSSMEIRKKLDAILSSKSRLAKAPRLKGATWVLRADR